MKIIMLAENLVYKQGLVAEHGLSLYIETENKKLLFDTGQSGLFMQNAEKLGINIRDIDMVILSHGHYDHTGGLYPFLEKNTKAVVYASENIFIPKYHGPDRFIGIARNDGVLKQQRFIPVEKTTEIAGGVYIMPDIRIYNPEDTHFKGLSIKQDNKLITDEFTDELFLVIKQKEQINIITACSHRGITNICTSATNFLISRYN